MDQYGGFFWPFLRSTWARSPLHEHTPMLQIYAKLACSVTGLACFPVQRDELNLDRCLKQFPLPWKSAQIGFCRLLFIRTWQLNFHQCGWLNVSASKNSATQIAVYVRCRVPAVAHIFLSLSSFPPLLTSTFDPSRRVAHCSGKRCSVVMATTSCQSRHMNCE